MQKRYLWPCGSELRGEPLQGPPNTCLSGGVTYGEGNAEPTGYALHDAKVLHVWRRAVNRPREVVGKHAHFCAVVGVKRAYVVGATFHCG